MLKKILLSVAVVVVLLLAVTAFFMMQGPDLSAYEKFREPVVLDMPAQKMVVVEANGTPEVAAANGLAVLFKTYFKLPDVPKGSAMPAPRARWPKPLETPPEQWLGIFAMPVPESVTALPTIEPTAGLSPKLATWDYGDVAQILYVGPYDKEAPTVERLRAFIKAEGYEVVGAHEEEYLRGPGMFGKGDPEKYYTLIRYPVRKPGSLSNVDTLPR
jgi:effector-binding domain-containing protein